MSVVSVSLSLRFGELFSIVYFCSMIISMFQTYRITVILLLLLGYNNFVFGQKALTFPLDTEGMSLSPFSSVNIDLSDKVTDKQMQSATFVPIEHERQWQWHYVVWLRFVIDNRQAKDTTVNLFFEHPVTLLEVFRKDSTQLVSLGRTGTRHPKTQATLIFKLVTLPIYIRGNRLDTFYMYSFDHRAHVYNPPFPQIYTSVSLPQEVLTKHSRRFEHERWFFFFMAGFSLLLTVWALFKSAVNHWEKSNLYCGLMFLCYFFYSLICTRTISLHFAIFPEISLVYPVGSWVLNLVGIFMWLLYRSFLNTRLERPSVYHFMTGAIWVFGILTIAHSVVSIRMETSSITLFVEKAIEVVIFVIKLVLPILFLPYWRHPIYRYAALSSCIMALLVSSFFIFSRLGLDGNLPIWFSSLYFLFIPIATDGILFMIALTLRDHQVATENMRLQQQATISELKALRTQMNPHFIFNCLNAIKSYTLNHDTEGADFYLTKFSKLIRQVLENSRSEKITLYNELETLTLYLDMEKLRAGNKLDYEIQISDDLETDFIEIPPMLIQPYVENAIWHGLMHKETGGKIIVDCRQKDEKYLCVTILDNGIGRAAAAALKSKTATRHKSFGMKITSERMDIIKQLYNIETKITIEDLKNANGLGIGTKVTLEIPL